MQDVNLNKAFKSVVNQSQKAIDEHNFNTCKTPQVMRNIKTGAVYSVVFDHAMGQLQFTPLTRNTRGVHYRNDLKNMEFAGTGTLEQRYSNANI